MADAHQLVGQIRNDLKPLEDRILRHLYLEELEAGRLERAALQTFTGQQYHCTGMPCWKDERFNATEAYDHRLHRSPA